MKLSYRGLDFTFQTVKIVAVSSRCYREGKFMVGMEGKALLPFWVGRRKKSF
jgi:hypothetical protein